MKKSKGKIKQKVKVKLTFKDKGEVRIPVKVKGKPKKATRTPVKAKEQPKPKTKVKVKGKPKKALRLPVKVKVKGKPKTKPKYTRRIKRFNCDDNILTPPRGKNPLRFEPSGPNKVKGEPWRYHTKYAKDYWLTYLTEKYCASLKNWDNYNNRTVYTNLSWIHRTYEGMTNSKFLYIKKSQLNNKKKVRSILAYILIEDLDSGVSMVTFKMRRKIVRNIPEWEKIIMDKGKKGLRELFVNTILVSMNAKHNANWRFLEFIGWSFPL